MKRTHESSGDAQSELAGKVSQGVWEVLQGVLGSASRIIKKQKKKDLEVDEDVLRRNLGEPRDLTNELFRIIQHAYQGIPFETLEACEDTLRKKVGEILKENPPAAAGGDDDVQPMEEAQALTPVVESETLSHKASKAVWGVIEDLFPDDATCAELDVKDENLLNLDLLGLRSLLIEKVPDAYPDFVIHIRKLRPMTSAVMKVIETHKKQMKMNRRDEKGLAAAFGGDYYGTADDEFEKHLTRCCTSYSTNSAVYTAPYVAITQSSGFGKSRILCRLAQKLERQRDSKTRLLYICGRDIPWSTGFPVATPQLFRFTVVHRVFGTGMGQ